MGRKGAEGRIRCFGSVEYAGDLRNVGRLMGCLGRFMGCLGRFMGRLGSFMRGASGQKKKILFKTGTYLHRKLQWSHRGTVYIKLM